MSQGGYEEILSDEEDSLDSLLDEGVRDKWYLYGERVREG